MSDEQPFPPVVLQVVLTDANVLYSRVLRDYLLYAAEYHVIAVAWSREILREAVDHLVERRPAFTRDSADRLIAAMTKTFPYAERNPEPEDFKRLEQVVLPDEGDRHVIAAALASEADIVCTNNTRDFPSHIAAKFGFVVMTPDDLICRLISEFPTTMEFVHKTSVANLPGATDESTIKALRAAGAPRAAVMMSEMLKLGPM